MESIKNNDFYDRHALYAPADILNVCKAEDDEQQRRIGDTEGENNKRVLANNLSLMFHENLRATWFQRGSSFVLSLLGSVRKAVSHKASDISVAVSNKAGDLGHKAAINITNTADDLGNKAQEALNSASSTLSDKAGEVGLKAQEKAHQLSDSLAHKAGEAAHNISSSVSSNAHIAAINIRDKSFDAAQSASSFFSDKFQEYSHKLKEAVTSMSLYKRLGNLTGNTNMTFAMLEEEQERARRMNSSSEKYAIDNALKLASMIKARNNSTECDLTFSTKLLEETERTRRISEAKVDNVGIDKAKAVSDLISQKFSGVELKKEIKTEQAGEIKKPAAAAM